MKLLIIFALLLLSACQKSLEIGKETIIIKDTITVQEKYNDDVYYDIAPRDHFDNLSSIYSQGHKFPMIPHILPKTVYLYKSLDGYAKTLSELLTDIDRDGFKAAPANYLAGILADSAECKKLMGHGWVVILAKENMIGHQVPTLWPASNTDPVFHLYPLVVNTALNAWPLWILVEKK